MKKVIALALMMLIGASPGFCVIDTVDRVVIKDRVASNFGPERDAGRLVGFTKDSLFKGMDMLLKPIDPVAGPIRKFTGDALRMPGKVVNTTYDYMTKPIPGYKK